MMAADGEVVGGICHALGENAALPAAWLVYFNVDDLDAALAEARVMGGVLINGPRGEAGEMRFAVLRDPAGAAFALVEQPAS
jgi:predicted enzyme related to lactoylglutathione lyase